MATDWTPYELKESGHAEWLVRNVENFIDAIRSLGGVPTNAAGGYIKAYVPTLKTQTETLNRLKDTAPGSVIPTGVIKFTT